MYLNEFRFRYQDYDNFLKFIKDNDYQVYTVGEWFENKPNEAIIIRHDVDVDILSAKKIADIEWNRYCIKTTYCVMPTSPAYNLYEPIYQEALTSIQENEHEIGLHFNISDNYNKNYVFDDYQLIYLKHLIDYNKKVLLPMLELQRDITALSYHNPSVIGLQMNEYPIIEGYNNTHYREIFQEDRYLSDSCQELRQNPFDFIEENYGKFPLQLNFHPLHFTEWGEDYRGIINRYVQQQSKILDNFLKPNRAYRQYWSK